MKNDFELIKYENNLPISISVQSVHNYKLHLHNENEIIYVVKGSIYAYIDKKYHLLKENDLIYINSSEIHSTNSTKEDNLLIVLQFDADYLLSFFPNLSDMFLKRVSFKNDIINNKEINQILREHLIQIMWELNKKTVGYEFVIISKLISFIAYLVRNSYISIKSKKSITNKNDSKRLIRIINFIKNNYSKKILLKDLAIEEHINFYYLSHFFKEKTGLTFKEHLNNYRLEKALELLIYQKKSISEVIIECGFGSLRNFSKSFKKKYKYPPGEYRKRFLKSEKIQRQNNKKDNKNFYLSINSIEGLNAIFGYLKNEQTDLIPKLSNKLETINIDCSEKGKPFKKYWSKLATFSRAQECLRSDLQQQLKELQQTLNFGYVRFHGIFNDEMMILNKDENGNIVYNWLYVDLIFDFFKKINIKPFLELSFMPTELSSSPNTVFWWKGNISPPTNIQSWKNMVIALIKHCINRYGIDEVKSWYFEVWNEPDYINHFWEGSKSDYFKFYQETVEAIRSVCSSLKVGGPALLPIIYRNDNWLDDFVYFCDKENVPLDFISFHIYSDNFFIDYQKNNFINNKFCPEGPEVSFHESNYVKKIIQYYMDSVQKISEQKFEYHVTEWNISARPYFLVRDTAFMAPYIIKNLLENLDTVDSIGYWTFTDILEEHKAPLSPFHGGLGMINVNNIKKPSYFAYYFLSKLGDTIVDQGNGYIVTKNTEGIQLLFYHATYFNSLTLHGDSSSLKEDQLYTIFEEKPDKKCNVTLYNMFGNHKITQYELNQKNGSAFDEWSKMGKPADLTKEEINFLKHKAVPNMNVSRRNINNNFSIELNIPVHGCILIVLEKEV